MDCFSQPDEQGLRDRKAENDAERNRERDLKRLKPLGGGIPSVDQLVGRVVDARARHERKDSGQQIHRRRTLADDRHGAGEDCQDQGADKAGEDRAKPCVGDDIVKQPADCPGEAAEDQLLFRRGE